MRLTERSLSLAARTREALGAEIRKRLPALWGASAEVLSSMGFPPEARVIAEVSPLTDVDGAPSSSETFRALAEKLAVAVGERPSGKAG